MDITKNIAKAVLNKNYAEAKESVYKSLYAKASLAMDEARYYIADALFNRSAEGDSETVSEGDWGGGFQTSKEAWREEMKKMRAEAKWNKDKAKRAAKKAKAAKKAVKEEAEQVDETWKSLKKTKANLDAIRKTGKRVALQHGEGDTLYKVMKPKKAVKEDFEQIDEVMTRKHFQQVADLIKANPDAKKREELAAHHSQIFKKSNPRFDQARFNKACGVGGCK
jgi:hypothetical protein